MVTPDPINDQRMAEAAARGDRGGLAEIYDSYAPHLYDYCRSLLGDSVTDAAADVVQDVFVAAWEHIGRLRDAERLRVWLYALARSQCLNQPTAAGIDLMVGPEAGAAAPDYASPAPFGPGGTRTQDVTRYALGELDLGDREVLDLALRHGVGRIDLAAVLGVSEGEAHGRVASARARFEGAVAALMAPGGRDEHISAAALLQDLPLVTPPSRLRDRVLHAAFDPEAIGHRAHVVVPPFDSRGFPVQHGTRRRAGRRPALIAAAVVLVVAAAGVGGGVVLLDGGGDESGQSTDVPVLAAPSRLPTLPGGVGTRGPIPARTGPAATPTTDPTAAEAPNDPAPQRGPQPRRSRDPVRSSGSESEDDQPTRLTVAPNRVNLGTSSRATVFVGASGGASMWGSSASSDALSVSPESGAVPEGGTMRATITLDRSRVSGSGRAFVYIGTLRGQVQTVTVTWS